jgi:hypothetical protein
LTRLEAVISSNRVAIRIDQEVMLGSRNARRDMGEHQIVPPEERDQAVAGREVDAQLPFRGLTCALTSAVRDAARDVVAFMSPGP